MTKTETLGSPNANGRCVFLIFFADACLDGDLDKAVTFFSVLNVSIGFEPRFVEAFHWLLRQIAYRSKKPEIRELLSKCWAKMALTESRDDRDMQTGFQHVVCAGNVELLRWFVQRICPLDKVDPKRALELARDVPHANSTVKWLTVACNKN